MFLNFGTPLFWQLFTLFNLRGSCLRMWSVWKMVGNCGPIYFWVRVYLAGGWNSGRLFHIWNRFWFIKWIQLYKCFGISCSCVCSDKFNIFMLFGFSVLENTLVSAIVHHVLLLKACVLECDIIIWHWIISCKKSFPHLLLVWTFICLLN